MTQAAIQGESSLPARKSRGFAEEPSEIPLLSFILCSLPSLSWRCKNAEEVKSHLDHQKKKLLVQISTRTALH